MIRRVVDIIREDSANDTVELGWFDMQKPNLTATSDGGVDFIMKVKFAHLHEGDILLCEDGYKIEVKRAKDSIIEMDFATPLDFAKVAYEIGNRHQPIYLDEYKIVVLDDISLADIISNAMTNS